MFRALFFAAGLTVAAPSLACGGANCGKSCHMNHETDASAEFAKVDAAEGTKVALTVTGMHCGACSKKVVAALTALQGVKLAAVSYETGEAKIAYDDAAANTQQMIEAIKGLGFEASVKAAS